MAKGQPGDAMVWKVQGFKKLDDVAGTRFNCTMCHTLANVHGGERAIGQCSRCHGGNGAPPITEDHTGWELLDCGACHPTGTHEGVYSFTDCGGCHGGNGLRLLSGKSCG